MRIYGEREMSSGLPFRFRLHRIKDFIIYYSLLLLLIGDENFYKW